MGLNYEVAVAMVHDVSVLEMLLLGEESKYSNWVFKVVELINLIL